MGLSAVSFERLSGVDESHGVSGRAVLVLDTQHEMRNRVLWVARDVKRLAVKELDKDSKFA